MLSGVYEGGRYSMLLLKSNTSLLIVLIKQIIYIYSQCENTKNGLDTIIFVDYQSNRL